MAKAKKSKKVPAVASGKAKVQGPTTFDCLPVTQGTSTFYVFKGKAADLWRLLRINRKTEDEDGGYQRLLSPSRVRAVSNYIRGGKVVPLSILVTIDEAKIEAGGRRLVIDKESDAGWVIDGQHRLAGTHESGLDIELPVVAFIGLPLPEQIAQFVTINREAKGVPTSLYYDLLKHLPAKTKPAEVARERAADIAHKLKSDEESPFAGRIVTTTMPKRGQLSLNNFVRKIAPLLLEGRGPLALYTGREQAQVIENYFRAIEIVFPKDYSKANSTFFQTLGFGALVNALPTAFYIALKHHNGFRVEDVTKVLMQIKHFDFGAWESMGTGSAAEIQAGEDLKTELNSAFETNGEGQALLNL